MASRHPSLVPLSHDHRDALALAFRLLHPSPPGPVTALTPASTPAERAADAVRFHDDELRPHFDDEETLLFPLVLALGDAALGTLVAALRADHAQLTAHRDALAGRAAGDDPSAELAALGTLLETHVRREERELFALVPARLAAADLTALGETLQARRADRVRARACPLPTA